MEPNHSIDRWVKDQEKYILKVERDTKGQNRVVDQEKKSIKVFFDRLIHPDAYNIEKIEKASTGIKDTLYTDLLTKKVKQHDSRILKRLKNHPVIAQIFYPYMDNIERCLKKGEDSFREKDFESASEYFRAFLENHSSEKSKRNSCGIKYVISCLKKEPKTQDEYESIGIILRKNSYAFKNSVVNALIPSLPQ